MVGATNSSLVLELARTHAPQDPYAFRFESQTYTLRTEGGGREVIEIGWGQQLLADLEAMRRPDRDPSVVQRLGETMAGFLQKAWPTRAEAIARAHDAGERVVVTVRSNAAELYALPWELLTLPGRGQHIGGLPRVLIRYERPETKTTVESPSPRLDGGRILLAWSAAAGAVPAADHEAVLRRICAAAHPEGEAALEVLPNASVRSIVDALKRAERNGHPFAVLHLLCHGGRNKQTFGLVLDGDQRPVTVNADTWRTMLSPRAGGLRLVVLAACEGGNAGEPGNHLGSVAQALHAAGIESVVASRYALSAAGSTLLTESLYGGLLHEHESLEDALLRARAELHLDPVHLDWAAIQLCARAADGDDTRPFVFRPYRGLLAFESGQTPFFHGRQAEREEVLSDLQALVDAGKPRLLVIAGASGTGKSSLVRAGAIPDILATRDGTWEHTIIRPGDDPLGNLQAALSSREDDDRPFLLVVDQFEEIFTHTKDKDARVAFARRLWTLAGADTGICCMISLRVDFLGRCGELRLDENGTRLDGVAYDEAHRVFVAQMSAEQLRVAITRPAALAGLTLSEGLAERIVAEVGTEPGALPLMQYTLDLMWQTRRGRVLSVEAYDGLGGIVGSLERRADALLESLSEAELLHARRMLTQLVGLGDDDTGDTRRRVPVEQLWADDRRERRDQEAVLRRFVDERLVVRDDRTRGGATVEIAHEALIRRWDRLREWLGDERERRIGRYVVLERVREGSREQTFFAYDPDLDRRVKIKLLRVGRRGAEERGRLRDQARALARLSHPNAQAIYDVGVARGHVYLALEMVEGVPLREWLAAEPRSTADVVERFVSAAEALEAAHSLGLVHRAFNPEAVWIDGEGKAIVVDFAFDRNTKPVDTGRSARTIAARAQARRSGPLPVAKLDDGGEPMSIEPSLMTSMSESSMMSDPAYQPPEQLRGRAVEPASDQFSFCVTLYEALQGERPFSGQGVAAFAQVLAEQSRASSSQHSGKSGAIPEPLRKVLLRGLAGEPKERWSSMTELAAELARVVHTNKGGGRRSLPWPVGLAVVLGMGALAGGAWAISTWSSDEPVSECADGPAMMEEIWNEQRRRSVRDAIFGTARARAVSTWKRLEPQIDAYAEAWADRSAAACQAGSKDEASEDAALVTACLQKRKHDLSAVLDVLGAATAVTVEHGVELVEGLPRLERCDDLDALRERARGRGSVPEQAQQQLAAARATLRGGEGLKAQAEADAIIEQAKRDEQPALLAQAMLTRARARARQGDAGATDDLLRALELGLSRGQPAVVMDAALELAEANPDDLSAAAVWGSIAMSLAERPTAYPRERAKAHGVMGSIRRREGDLATARTHHERALEGWTEIGGAEHSRVAAQHLALVEVARAEKDSARAKTHAEHAVAIRESGAGGEADLAAARFVLAQVLEVGPQALELAEKARDGYAGLGGQQESVAKIDAWIAARSGEDAVPEEGAGQPASDSVDSR